MFIYNSVQVLFCLRPTVLCSNARDADAQFQHSQDLTFSPTD